MISIDNLSKSFGGRVLLDGIGFKINSRERVGLVGRNGHGKTTLMRMLLGEEEPDSGTISRPRHYRVGHVQQQIRFTEPTVLAEGMRGLPAAERDHHWKVEKVLAGLGFGRDDLLRSPSEFSGGYQVRLNLAKVLVSEPDLLLLDEPTNYLDIAAIRWAEQYLANWPRELLLITHDRGFMDRIVTHIVGIHRRKVRKVSGSTEKYYEQIAQEEEVYEKTRLNDEKRRKEIELFISRFRAKARLANMVQSRIKTLARMEKRDKLEKQANLEFCFRSRPFPGRHLLTVEGLSFGYRSDQPLIRELSFAVGRGERIGVVGRNGRGKTTLLKLLANLLPATAGAIRYSPAAVMGYFEQTNVSSLRDERTVEQEIQAAAPDVDRQTARSICGAMMFEGDEALKKVAVLSGGEKSRVMLGRLLLTPVNLLLLDEPTNHLDMQACDALLEALDSFDGALLMVTHNEMFLHALAERLIVFRDDGGVEVFEGSYGRFLERGGWGDEPPSAADGAGQAAAVRVSRKELKRLRTELLGQRARVLKPLEARSAKAEARIEACERALTELHAAMQEASQASDGARITRIGREIHAAQSEIDRLFDELEQATNELETHRDEFDARLQQLEAGLSD